MGTVARCCTTDGANHLNLEDLSVNNFTQIPTPIPRQSDPQNHQSFDEQGFKQEVLKL